MDHNNRAARLQILLNILQQNQTADYFNVLFYKLCEEIDTERGINPHIDQNHLLNDLIYILTHYCKDYILTRSGKSYLAFLFEFELCLTKEIVRLKK